MRIVAVTVLCAGCAQLFGIDETSSPPEAKLDLRRVSVGSAIVTEPLELANPPTFLTGDGVLVGSKTAPGAWSAPTTDVTGVVYRSPDLPVPFDHVLAFARVQRADFLAFGYSNAQPASASTMMVNVALPDPYAATQRLELVAIGAWARRVLAGAELPAIGATAIATALPYTSFAAMTQTPAAKITAQDVVVVLRYVGNVLTGQMVVPPFDQTATDAISGAMLAVVPDTPFDAAISPPTVATRYAAQTPAVSAPTLTWRIDASPGYAAGAPLGVGLDGGAIAMTDTLISRSFANPFGARMWQPMLTYATSATRSFMAGGVAITLSSSLVSLVDPASGLTLDLPAGLPKVIAIAGTPLASDGMTVTLDPAEPVAVDITADQSTNTVYKVTVFDIAVVGTSVTRTPVIEVLGPEPHLVLPPDVLQRGHTYTLVATCIAGGFENAAAGDLQTFTLPFSYGTASSGVFTLAP